MKKIVFIHGVSGVSQSNYANLKKSIEKNLDASVDLYEWKSTWQYEIPKGLRLAPARKMFCRIFTDIEHAILHAKDEASTLPDADIYIGSVKPRHL